MGVVMEWKGFAWYVKQDYPASLEPVREYEMTVLSLCELLSSKDKVFVDVGACTGKYAIRMSKFYGKVIAIEPNPINLDYLKENIELNDCKNIEIIDKAISNTKGVTRLALKGAQSHIAASDTKNSIVVDVETLDNLVEHADVIKIDVEGVEWLVVRGAEKLIDKSRPIFIIEHTEYWSTDQPRHHKNILKLLMSKNYEPYNYNQTHWVYVPKEWSEDISDIVKPLLMRNHIFYEVIIRNLKEGRAWYHGLPHSWWHGMSLLEFYYAFLNHYPKEKEWEDVYKKTLERYLR